MKILFLGDSITEGVGASAYENNYVSCVGEMLNCEVVNYGVGGTRIGRQTSLKNGYPVWNYDFRLRAQIMEEKADRVFVFGGTNDYGHGNLHIGSPDQRTPNTFCDELRKLIEFLCEKYGKEKLCFILPMRRFCEEGVCCKGEAGDEQGVGLLEYEEAIRQIVSEYKIDVIDLYNNGISE